MNARPIALLALTTATVVVVRDARATFTVGYADEFVSAIAECNESNCTTQLALWSQTSGADGSRWAILGQQGANATGRANAREKVMFKYLDSSTTASGTVTVNLARYYTDSPPAKGAACNSVTQTYVASASQTLGTSSGFPAQTGVNNRMLPVLDFHLDTASPGTNRGYTTNFAITGDHITPYSIDNCYVIEWF